MRAVFLSLVMIALSAAVAQAQSWDAVGRLDIDGKGFCTGTLIAPDLVLTAAHCMFDRTSGLAVSPLRVRFRAGLQGDQMAADRAVSAAVIHPAYDSAMAASHQKVRHDVALLQLAQPIPEGEVTPFDLSTAVRRGAQISVVSYSLGRQDAPALREGCMVLNQQTGVMIFDCDVTFGASGSPVFHLENGALRLVSIVSAMAQVNGQTLALGMDLAEPIAVLKLTLAEQRGDGLIP